MIPLENIFIFIPMIMSIFWILIIFIDENRNKAKTMLGLFMILEAILYLCHSIFFSGNKSLYLIFDPIYNLVGLSTYPVYYMYVRLLTKDPKFNKKLLIHILPGILIASSIQIMLLIMSKEEKILYFDNVLINKDIPFELNNNITIISSIFLMGRIIFGFQSIFYLIKSYILAKRYNHSIENFYSNMKGKSLTWLKNVIICIMITTTFSFTVNILGRSLFSENHNSLLFIPSIIFTGIIFMLGYQGYKQKHGLNEFNIDKEEPEDITNCELPNKELMKTLCEVLKNGDFYLDPDINISKLASTLNTNRTYLSNIINQKFLMSFNDYINKRRIDYAKTLLEKDKNKIYTLLAISEDSGFGSFSSFNRAFKKFENITANEYRNNNINH